MLPGPCVHPLLCSVAACLLDALPQELLIPILTFISADSKAVISCAATSTRLRAAILEIFHSPPLWQLAALAKLAGADAKHRLAFLEKALREPRMSVRVYLLPEAPADQLRQPHTQCLRGEPPAFSLLFEQTMRVQLHAPSDRNAWLEGQLTSIYKFNEAGDYAEDDIASEQLSMVYLNTTGRQVHVFGPMAPANKVHYALTRTAYGPHVIGMVHRPVVLVLSRMCLAR
ncbi:hypothetical protein AB1Y20_019666 [Prymnesium parvum]|uniref:F-box domain-containing protein n=1 Tax=Prymnesium parvum TaxID=97485 RepID=A0AB34JVS1_PRYPA